jgi:hypothetical protein
VVIDTSEMGVAEVTREVLELVNRVGGSAESDR